MASNTTGNKSHPYAARRKRPGSIPLLEADYHSAERHYSDEVEEATVGRSTRVVWIFFLLIAALITWSYFAMLDEDTTGSGKVIPSSRAQVIQSLEGGILLSLEVSEGYIVERGQVLAQLDPTQFRSDAEETAARYRAALARVARLTAEVNGTALTFPGLVRWYGHARGICNSCKRRRLQQRHPVRGSRRRGY